jgi:hypothetical protein
MAQALAWLTLVLTAAACADPADPGEPAPDGAPAAGDPQLPPRGHAALAAWLGAGHYQAWACEPAPHAARPPGAHGENRICSNAALSAAEDGPYPVGAAAVKELYRGGALAGYAVGVKVAAPAAGASWYWYEAIGASVIADRVDHGLCSGCHAGAPRDFVFTRVP